IIYSIIFFIDPHITLSYLTEYPKIKLYNYKLNIFFVSTFHPDVVGLYDPPLEKQSQKRTNCFCVCIKKFYIIFTGNNAKWIASVGISCSLVWGGASNNSKNKLINQKKICVNKLYVEMHAVKSKKDKWVDISYPQQITCDDVDKLYKTEWISSIKIYMSQSKAQNDTCNIFEGNFIRGVTLQTNYLRKFSCLTFGIADRANYIAYSITPPDICYALIFVGFPGNGYLYGLQTTWENVCDVDQQEALSQAENFQ
ncbi:hypothetical protein RFI_03527, partial [Reticulomyxa filosa]